MYPLLNLLDSYCQLIGQCQVNDKKTEDAFVKQSKSHERNRYNIWDNTENNLSLPHITLELQFERQIVMLYDFLLIQRHIQKISTLIFLCFPYQHLPIHISFFHFLEWFHWLSQAEHLHDKIRKITKDCVTMMF